MHNSFVQTAISCLKVVSPDNLDRGCDTLKVDDQGGQITRHHVLYSSCGCCSSNLPNVLGSKKIGVHSHLAGNMSGYL